MKRVAVIAALMLLAACRQEVAQDTSPVEISADTIGHYCQMHLTEHPGPKAQVHLEGIPDPLFFSQVRDAIAFSRAPEQVAPILAIQVNDMGRPGATWDDPGVGNWIEAETAWFVIGSAREGAMGAPEAVPFASQDEAAAYAAAEGGTVTRLADIPDAAVLAPVAVPGLPEAGDAPADEAADEADFQSRLRALSHHKEAAE